jgi:hypothetical protein
MHTRRNVILSAAVFVVIVAIAVPVFAAFSNPLSTTAIRDAYFIGDRRDSQTKDFLAQYHHEFPNPNTDSYIYMIGIDTPFTEVVRHSEAALNYHAPDAVEEFENKSLPFVVTVQIALNSNYPTVTGDAPAVAQLVPDFWNDYKVRLIQNEEVKPVSIRGGPIYAYGWEFSPLVTGAVIQAVYDPVKLTADPIVIQVVSPDGQTVETKFDLAELR